MTQGALEVWPKLWHNLRATRETELAEQYPSRVACAWIGNSVQVAAKHYLQVTDEHFEMACEKAAHKAAQKPAKTTGNGLKRVPTESGDELRISLNFLDFLKKQRPTKRRTLRLMGDTGLEPVTSRV